MRSHGYHTVPPAIVQKAPFFTEERKTAFFNKRSNSTQTSSGSSFIQPKLTINEPNDKLEKEADAVADDVVKKNNADTVQRKQLSDIQRKCKECEEEEKMVQKKPEGNSADVSASSGGIESTSGKGNLLPTKTLTEMNSAFGADFSQEHIHNDKDYVKMHLTEISTEKIGRAQV